MLRRVTTQTEPANEHLLPRVLRAARIRAGFTQTDFAVACGVQQASVAYWESGRRATSETTLEKAARALGMSVMDLLINELTELREAQRRSTRKRREPVL